MRTSFLALIVMTGFFWFGLSGCATQKYVRDQISESQKLIEENQTEIAKLKETAEQQNEQLHELSRATEQGFTLGEEALERAVEAGKVARGKLLYEVTLTDEQVRFGFDKHDLSDEAKAVLDSLADRLKAENKNVFIEIQGHTDNIGPEQYNLRLGQARAEAVYAYLHTHNEIPLHRMDTFSYGESKPIADNDNPSNRAKNRRVTLVVIE